MSFAEQPPRTKNGLYDPLFFEVAGRELEPGSAASDDLAVSHSGLINAYKFRHLIAA
jgi:hypothetical protein